MQRVEIPRRSDVTLTVESDTEDLVHVHGYDLEQPVGPDEPATITFEALIPGVFRGGARGEPAACRRARSAAMTPVIGHAIGVRGDLPLPLWLVGYGAAAVLVVSFVALGALWTRSRLQPLAEGVATPPALDRAVAVLEGVARGGGLVLFAWVWAAALAGPLATVDNVAPYAIFAALWVGGLLVSGLLADVWSRLSPFETAVAVHAWVVERAEPVRPLPRLGVWPAAVGLLGFGWLELVYPYPADPRSLGVAITGYVVVMAAGAAVAGPGWIRSAEVFGALFRVVAAMAPLHRDAAGRLRLRAPLVGLADLERPPGTTALVLVALAITTYDGVTRQSWWEDGLVAGRADWAAVPIGTLGLLMTTGVVAGLYAWAMREAARQLGDRTVRLMRAYAHTLVPIALGYAVAHYFSLLTFEGQRLFIIASDPFGLGWDLFGTADAEVDFTVVSPLLIAWVQVGAIVLGHLAGVLLAHDRAVAGRRESATRSQIALLVVMVTYTVGGLVLLLGG